MFHLIKESLLEWTWNSFCSNIWRLLLFPRVFFNSLISKTNPIGVHMTTSVLLIFSYFDMYSTNSVRTSFFWLCGILGKFSQVTFINFIILNITIRFLFFNLFLYIFLLWDFPNAGLSEIGLWRIDKRKK